MPIAESFTIVAARTDQHIEDARLLCREYLDWLAIDHGIILDFQGVEDELRKLPGDYAPPAGELLLAYDGRSRPAGCIAVRPFEGRTCEIKRLYIRNEARGTGLGHRLAEAIVTAARSLGYSRAVLDTGDFMASAQRVYERAGFRDIPAYYENPLPRIRYLGRDL